MERPLNLTIIIGSTREGRFGPRVAAWFESIAPESGEFAVDVIDLLDADLPAHLANHPTPAVEEYRARLARADAFVVVTPEYNHGYPAPLKQAIDLAFVEWQAKPVAFVSYGGLSGGLRAVEQLRQVFAELHATTVRDTVSFHMAHGAFDASGQPVEADGYVVVTPEYNHGYPAALKQAIDLPHRQWRAKPVAFVSYGGISGGLRAVEQLRQVFAGLRAVTMYDTVSIANVWDAFDADGDPVDAEPLLVAAKLMVDELVWWAQVLRDGRTTRPFVA